MIKKVVGDRTRLEGREEEEVTRERARWIRGRRAARRGMLDIRGARRKVSDSSARSDAYTRASEVILSYGGLYHQFSRPGSGAAGVGSAARIYPRRLCTRERPFPSAIRVSLPSNVP